MDGTSSRQIVLILFLLCLQVVIIRCREEVAVQRISQRLVWVVRRKQRSMHGGEIAGGRFVHLRRSIREFVAQQAGFEIETGANSIVQRAAPYR